MRISLAVLIVAASTSLARPVAAQSPVKPALTEPTPAASTAPAAAPSPQSKPAASPAPPPSTLIQPALDNVRATLSGTRLEKWKRGSVRDEAAADISSILGELDSNMPQLLRDADAAPDALSKALPASRHIDALYDTFLRVYDAARIAGPGDQVDQIQQSLKGLSAARRALDERMLATAQAQEKQVVDLRATVQRQAAFKCPVAPPPPAPACPAAPPAKKPKKKPAPPAQPAPNQPSQQPAPAKPN